nr:unnamed protein product [Callosobruchus analis]
MLGPFLLVLTNLVLRYVFMILMLLVLQKRGLRLIYQMIKSKFKIMTVTVVTGVRVVVV